MPTPTTLTPRFSHDAPQFLVVVPCAIGGAVVVHWWALAGATPWRCDLAMLG